MEGMNQKPDGIVIADWMTQHHRVLMELGDCYAEIAQDDRAKWCYCSAASVLPRQAGPYVGLGILAMQSQNYQQALDAFETAVKIDSNCPEAYNGLAMAHHNMNNYPAAFEMYLKCLELDTDNLMALLGLFQTSCQMGTFGKIIEFLTLYLERHPADTSVLFCLATLYARDGRLAKARQTLLSLLNLQPEHIHASQMLREVEKGIASGGAVKS